MLPVRDVHILRWFMFIIPMWRGGKNGWLKEKVWTKASLPLLLHSLTMCWLISDSLAIMDWHWLPVLQPITMSLPVWVVDAASLRATAFWWATTRTDGGSLPSTMYLRQLMAVLRVTDLPCLICSEHCITTRIVIYLMLLSVGTVHLFSIRQVILGTTFTLSVPVG